MHPKYNIHFIQIVLLLILIMQHAYYMESIYTAYINIIFMLFSPFSNSVGIFDAAWDRGGMGSVPVKDRQRYIYIYVWWDRMSIKVRSKFDRSDPANV